MFFVKLILPFLPGFLLFFFIFGFDPLNFTSISWLPSLGDSVQTWMGWSFFCNSPWEFPLGLNPRYGLELNNSIIFTDSNPLFAFFFKIFSPWLPGIFQYSGLWLLCCLSLQSWFGWQLTAIYTRNTVFRFLGACLFSMSLPMIVRMMGHFNLVAHFLILAALCLCLEKKKKRTWRKPLLWALLLSVSTLTHSYIFVMASVLWAADLGDRLAQKLVNLQKAVIEALGIVLLCAFTCWQAGYFIIGKASSDGGFGIYRMNLWSIIDPDGIASWIMPDLPSSLGEGEGFAYLGMGGMLVCFCALVTAIVKKPALSHLLRTKWPFLLGLLFLALLALSNNMGLFIWEAHIAIPKRIEEFLQFFRASGRMFWPVLYTIMIFSLALVFRYWPTGQVILLLMSAIFLQSLDVAALSSNCLASGKNAILKEMTASLKDPFWNEAAQKYANVRGYPIRGKTLPRWAPLGYYALQNGMGTNVVYLSRYNIGNVMEIDRQTLEKIRNGIPDPDSLYIVDDETFKLARKTVPNALIRKIDGFNVIAPNWPEAD